MRLPVVHNVLSQPQTEINHPQPELFKLTAWKLSTDSSKREAFLRTLENYSEPPGGRVPRRITMLNTNDSVAGVVHGKLILVRQL